MKERLIDAMIYRALLILHLIAQIMADQFIDPEPYYFVVAVALQELEEFLLHEVELGEIVYWMAN